MGRLERQVGGFEKTVRRLEKAGEKIRGAKWGDSKRQMGRSEEASGEIGKGSREIREGK